MRDAARHEAPQRDKLYLVIRPAGEHSCDTTMVDLKVIEQL